MSYKEIERLRHAIATDFPKLKADGVIRQYEYRNHVYEFIVHDFGSYEYISKRKLK